MQSAASHIVQLYWRSQTQALSPAEQQEWAQFQSENPVAAAHLEGVIEQVQASGNFDTYRPESMDQLSETLLDRIRDSIHFERDPALADKRAHRIHFLKTAWFRYAAAVLLLIIGFSVYLLYPKKQVGELTTVLPATDVLPGSDQAMLTLSDGQHIRLTQRAASTIRDGEIAITNDQGTLRYSGSTSVAINTMTTPRGGQYKLMLADGTIVWLNAASSITYPTAFIGASREVSITGEAYFEVAGNKKQPFIVSVAGTRVEVLGTAFNVNAYPGEAAVKTTLIEGGVRVSMDSKIVYLQPGEQAVNTTGLMVNKNPNIRQVVAWKNGEFDFTDLDFAAAMRQLERWYDIKVVYDGSIPTEDFGGSIHKNLTLQQLLKGLNGVVARFRLEGRTLHVLPW